MVGAGAGRRWLSAGLRALVLMLAGAVVAAAAGFAAIAQSGDAGGKGGGASPEPLRAKNDVLVVVEGHKSSVRPLANDSGAPAKIIAFTEPAQGRLQFFPRSNAYIYWPSAGFTGNDSFSYTVADKSGHTDTATVDLVVFGVDETIKVTFGNGGQFQDFRRAVHALSDAGGVIEVLPGTYRAWFAFNPRNAKDTVVIRGVVGPNGELPHLKMPLGENGRPRGGNILTFGFGTSVTIENLELSDAKAGTAISVIKDLDRLTLRNVFVHDNRQGLATSGVDGLRVEIYDSEFARNGDGRNTKHNIYVGRIAELVVDNLHSHSSRGGHALKSVARNFSVTNSRFDTTLEPDPEASPFVGKTLLDFAAATRGLIDGCEFYSYFVRRKTGYAEAISARNRRPMHGADNPPYDSPAFFSEQFWDAVQAGGVDNPANPHLYPVYISNNTFVASGPGRDKTVAIRAFGTYPSGKAYMFAPKTFPLDAPDGWVERSVLYIANNTFKGYTDKALILLRDNPFNADPADYPNIKSPVDPWSLEGRIVDVGGNRGLLWGDDAERIGLPEWWGINTFYDPEA